MSEPLLYRFFRWLCEKTGHLGVRKAWIFDGHFHRDCGWCGRIISEPCKQGDNNANG